MNRNIRAVNLLVFSLLALTAVGVGLVVHDRQMTAARSYVALVNPSPAGISFGP